MGVITKERQQATATDLQRVLSQTDFTAYDYFSIKQALIQYLKINYPNDFNDYVESSVMMAFIEELAYLGELLAFRSDLNTNELKLAFVSDRNNALNLVRPLGYQSTRQGSASGTVKLITKLDSNGNPLDDNLYIAGLPRWIFTPAITVASAATSADLTTNISYLTIVDNHISFDVQVGAETLPYELTSTNYNSGLIKNSLDTNFLNLVFDGTNFVCIAEQGRTINETFVQNVSLSNLEYQTSHDNADTTIPVVKVAGTKWEFDASLYLPNPSNLNKFSTIHDSVDRLKILFGDGISSTIPLGIIDILYRITDGIKGNISSSNISDITITKVLSNSLKGNTLETFDLHITALSAFIGGTVQESLDSIRKHAPSVNRAQRRQVTGSDYKEVALQVAGVTSVQSIVRTQIGHDATGTYSSASFLGTDAIDGSINQFSTATNFDGAIPGIDYIHRIDAGESTTRYRITNVQPDPTGANNSIVYTTADIPIISGISDGSSGTLLLIDTSATFLTDGIKPGMGITNVTDNSKGSVVSVDSETQITTTLSGGTSNNFAATDNYEISQWPFTWSGVYQWDHWGANLNGANHFVSSSVSSGHAIFDNVLSSHFVSGAKILLVDHYTGNWYTSTEADLIFTITPSITVDVRLKDGNGVAVNFVPRGQMTLIIDYTYQSESTGLTVPSLPAPDSLGDYIFQDSTLNINIGDMLWGSTTGFGYLVLDIARNSQVNNNVTYDKLFISRNGSSGGIFSGGEAITRTVFSKKMQILENPSKINIIDLYILTSDSLGFPKIDVTNSSLLSNVSSAFINSSVETDNVFVHWGSIKELPIDLTVYLIPGTVNVSEFQNIVQQEVFDYFKTGRFTFGQDFRISQLVSHLHRIFSEIDYITHTTLSGIDKTVVPTQMISVDLNHKGVTVV